ncbi:alpha/beta hydrolase [Kocuria sp.]|uniref:alpha/beta hydrolase n=1 Tax=Kocuria sp. TaxID=1871328 RepID=UPI0026DF3A7E|nr:alpha/beta hydrolase-fold protein [Kocuria sp.]MDO5619023.1 alpha/beta hydrolase-fold protein [Kocuria sp.]
MFNITGLPILITSAVLFVLLLLVALLVVPRRRGPGVRKYVEQAVALVLVIFLALATTFLYLNRDNNWYGAWGDLFASNDIGTIDSNSYGSTLAQNATYKQQTGGTLTDLQRNPQSNPALGSVSSRESTGQWLNVTIKPTSTSKTQLTVDALVWLPPGYVANSDRSYPVVVGFPGVPGSVSTYQNGLDIDNLVLKNVQNKTMQAPIMVFPDVFPKNADTECVDGKAGPWETWITQDLRSWITTNLRTVNDRKAWATTGYSAGGWCSAMISMRHPDQYGWGISLAGYFDVEYSSGQQQDDPKDPKYLLDQVAQQQKPDIGLWAFAAGQDQPAIDSLNKFKPSVTAPTSLVSNISQTGGHRTPVWITPQQDALNWLGQVSPWFAPEST